MVPITAQFAGGVGNAFTVVRPAEGHESVLIDAGISVQWTPTFGTYFGYNGRGAKPLRLAGRRLACISISESKPEWKRPEVRPVGRERK
jgi:hypothetical protein